MFWEIWLKFSNRFSCLYKHGQSPLNLRRREIYTCNVIFCPAELSNFWWWYDKWFGQGRRRRLLWVSFQLSVLLKLFIHICQEFVKKWTHRIVSNSLFLREVTCSYNRQWEFSVTKPICYKDVFVNSFCSPAFRFANSFVVEPFLWLII